MPSAIITINAMRYQYQRLRMALMYFLKSMLSFSSILIVMWFYLLFLLVVLLVPAGGSLVRIGL